MTFTTKKINHRGHEERRDETSLLAFLSVAKRLSVLGGEKLRIFTTESTEVAP
jgi:hypothetical protein